MTFLIPIFTLLQNTDCHKIPIWWVTLRRIGINIYIHVHVYIYIHLKHTFINICFNIQRQTFTRLFFNFFFVIVRLVVFLFSWFVDFFMFIIIFGRKNVTVL